MKETVTVVDLGEGPTPPPPLFLDQTEAVAKIEH